MRKGDTRLFGDSVALTNVINLGLAGFSPHSLSIVFGCHRSSIENQFEKYHILVPTGMASIQHITQFVVGDYADHYETDSGIVYSRGKTYAEYLRESMERNDVIRTHGQR